MRLLAAAILGSLLVSPMDGADIERALSIARARDAERQQFHRRYVVDLPGQVVAQIEVITEFRRLVIIAEEHVLRGDWMFTRGRRAGEDAIKGSRGVVTLKALVRLNPMNTFIDSPPYVLAVDDTVVATQLTPQYSVPFKARDGKALSSLIGVALEASIPAGGLGQSVKTVSVMLDRRLAGSAAYDFSKLD
jgi:hypothetical protein